MSAVIIILFDRSLHFLSPVYPAFISRVARYTFLFNPNIQTKIRRISKSNNYEHRLTSVILAKV